MPGENQAMLDTKKPEKKPSRFSLKWLLRKTRETKSSTNQEKTSNIIPKSKSLDVSLSLHRRDTDKNETDKIRSPTVPYMKIVPRKISVCGIPSKTIVTASQVFKTSYSSNDVQTLLSSNTSQVGYPSPSLTRLQSQEPCSSACCSNGSFPSHRKTSNVLKKEVDLPSSELLLDCGGPSARCAYKPYSKKTLSVHSEIQSLHGSCIQCRLCLMLVPSKDFYSLKDCGCSFCSICIQQYLTINIREGNVILTCPDAECSRDNQISTKEVEQLVDREIFDMYQRFKLNREVELDPTRTWCPGVNCETICYVRPSPDGKNKTGVLVHCPNCRSKFCSLCKDTWHFNKSCEEVQKENHEEGQFLTEQDDDPRIKRCPNPNCRVPIERDQGCAQMMCKQCKHVFCWYCLASLDDDFLLRHYDKGPCKNKLGHSRASVVWHRTQVVGIFAGFGFLLLIASPLLLLAAPCLLCCRCKQCTKFFDDEPTTV